MFTLDYEILFQNVPEAKAVAKRRYAGRERAARKAAAVGGPN